jgi:hypothetical protein
MAVPAVQADEHPVCKNNLVTMIYDAGFRGNDVRASYAIVMRESNGQNLGPGNPSFNGSDYGIWQINAPSHSDAAWWSVEAMLDPQQQSRIAYKYLSSKGNNWLHWGLGESKSGKFYLDASLYGEWSSWQHENWIWNPFVKYWNQFPRKCKFLTR